MITLNQFWEDVARLSQGHLGQRQRYGQIAFNLLCEVRPDLSEQVRGSLMDPFYATSAYDERFRCFYLFLSESWSK